MDIAGNLNLPLLFHSGLVSELLLYATQSWGYLTNYLALCRVVCGYMTSTVSLMCANIMFCSVVTLDSVRSH